MRSVEFALKIRLFFKEKIGTKKIGIESKIISHSFYEEISHGLNLEAADGIIEDLCLVKEAQKVAISILRPNISCTDAHMAAIKSFEKHGVGIEVHEEPRLSIRSERILQVGIVVTVELGLYYADYGGCTLGTHSAYNGQWV